MSKENASRSLMSLSEFSSPFVNWPLFLFTSLIIILRTYLPSICQGILNRFYSPTKAIDGLTSELKRLQDELNSLSPQDEFAAYTRKERQRSALVQRLKVQRTEIESQQKTLLSSVRLILNLGTILLLIYFTFTGQQHQSIPLFNLPFFRFPLIIWLMAFHTFLTTLDGIYSRYRTNKRAED